MGGDAILRLFFLGPPAVSLLIAIGVVGVLGVQQARGQSATGFAWPAIVGAAVLPLAAYPLLFRGGYAAATLGAMGLIWLVSGGFGVLGLIRPPPPTRRWMFAAGLASTGLGILFIAFLTALGNSMGRMH